jgi:hypothetical protein
MPDETEFVTEQPTLEIKDDVAFLHIDAKDFAMRPNLAIRFIEQAFRNLADWLAGKAE